MEEDYERNFIQDFIQDFSQDVQETLADVQGAADPDGAEQDPVYRRPAERMPAHRGAARWNPAELSSIEQDPPGLDPAGQVLAGQSPAEWKLVYRRTIQQESVQQNAAPPKGHDGFIYHLIQEALKARETAYAPYSHYTVGAALLAAGGLIYTGCNIENASYGASNCAERTAIFKAVSEGRKHFLAIAVAGGMEGAEPVEYAYPCGICRQVMQEFAGKNFLVIVAKSTEDFRKLRLEDLLPHGFGGESIR